MHERQIAQRNAVAAERIQSAATALATQYGIATPALQVHVGPAGLAVARLHEREAQAEFLEALAARVLANSSGSDAVPEPTALKRRAS